MNPTDVKVGSEKRDEQQPTPDRIPDDEDVLGAVNVLHNPLRVSGAEVDRLTITCCAEHAFVASRQGSLVCRHRSVL